APLRIAGSEYARPETAECDPAESPASALSQNAPSRGGRAEPSPFCEPSHAPGLRGRNPLLARGPGRARECPGASAARSLPALGVPWQRRDGLATLADPLLRAP